VRLIFQNQTVSNTVSVYGKIKNNPDVQTPPGQEGVSSLLDGLFEYGTGNLDRVAFQKALDEIGATASAGDSFSLHVLPAEFERGVELLADNELNPALPESALATVRAQLAGEVAGEIESPDFLMDLALGKALYPKDDPSLRHATPETVESLTLQEVKNYYQHAFRPELTVIVVIGNLSADEAKRVISKYFEDWKATGPSPETELPPVPPNQPSVVAVPNPSRVQDKVTLAETLGINRFHRDYYSLQLGNHILGGGFYATRLYRDLRENSGLVYFVSSSLDLGKTRGLYKVEYGCDPPNVPKARAIVERNLKTMQAIPASPQELQQAKALLLRGIPLSESSVHAIASGMISRVLVGLPLDEPVRAAHKYVQLSPEDVQAAFAKWIRPGDLVQVSQGPPPQ
jgi:zinc protease